MLVLGSRRSGGSSEGFALVAFRPEARKRFNIGPQAAKHHNQIIIIINFCQNVRYNEETVGFPVIIFIIGGISSEGQVP